MSKDKKQIIKCDVDSCKYNNTEDRECELEEIKVSSTCDTDDCENTEDTICDSFEKEIDQDDEYQEEFIEEELEYYDSEEEDDDDDNEDNEFEDEDDEEEFEIEEYVEIIETEEE